MKVKSQQAHSQGGANYRDYEGYSYVVHDHEPLPWRIVWKLKICMPFVSYEWVTVMDEEVFYMVQSVSSAILIQFHIFYTVLQNVIQ